MGLTALALTAAPLARAQTLEGPLRIVVGYAPGGAADRGARLLADGLKDTLGVPVIVENKTGAGGRLSAQLVKATPADQNVLLMGNPAIAVVAPLVASNVGYDPRKDFSPINGFGLTMHVLMVKPGFPAKTMPEFIAYAKQRPGKVSVGSTTTSVQTQIATMNKLAGIDLLVVPYKGIPATITDVIGGTLDATIVDLANAQAQAKAGKLVPIAVTSLQRNPLVPDWPAISETLPGFDFPSWVGLVGPAGMPRELVDKLNAAVAQAVRHPDVSSRLGTIGMAPMLMSSANAVGSSVPP
jgi:tripartite-type tricarboxylate transporter receptor subunit TctC